MSRMVDGLGVVARAAGDGVAGALSAPDSIDVMEARIRRGVRRRRLSMAGAAAAAVVVVGAGVVAVPQLLSTAPAPAAPSESSNPDVLSTDGDLTVYADGSMAVLTSGGDTVEIPAPEPGEPRFSTSTQAAICSIDVTAHAAGWDDAVPGARQLLGAGRPLHQGADGEVQQVGDGQELEPARFGGFTPLAFAVEADQAIADSLAFRATAVIQFEGETMGYQTQLDAAPEWTLEGEDTVHEVAAVQMRFLPSDGHGYCVEDKAYTDQPTALLTRHLIVDVFLIDHAGSARLLATHTSWTRTEITP